MIFHLIYMVSIQKGVSQLDMVKHNQVNIIHPLKCSKIYHR